MRTESTFQARFHSALSRCFTLIIGFTWGLLFFTFTSSYDANAQSLSVCNNMSDVRPSAQSLSPREKCQCEIDSSYCIIPNAGSPPSSSGSNLSKCAQQGKVPIPIGTNKRKCVSCWAFSGLVVGGSTSAIDFILEKGFNPAKLGRWAAKLAVYVWCKARSWFD